jgi:hypothetical protein
MDVQLIVVIMSNIVGLSTDTGTVSFIQNLLVLWRVSSIRGFSVIWSTMSKICQNAFINHQTKAHVSPSDEHRLGWLTSVAGYNLGGFCHSSMQ